MLAVVARNQALWMDTYEKRALFTTLDSSWPSGKNDTLTFE